MNFPVSERAQLFNKLTKFYKLERAPRTRVESEMSSVCLSFLRWVFLFLAMMAYLVAAVVPATKLAAPSHP
jgi:hypothetical protein